MKIFLYSIVLFSSIALNAASYDLEEACEQLGKRVKALNAQDHNGDTMLHHAVRNKDMELVNNCLFYKLLSIDIQNKNKETPLFIAASLGHVEIVKLLLSKKAKHTGNTFGITPLHQAILNNNIEVVKAFINAKCKAKKKMLF